MHRETLDRWTKLLRDAQKDPLIVQIKRNLKCSPLTNNAIAYYCAMGLIAERLENIDCNLTSSYTVQNELTYKAGEMLVIPFMQWNDKEGLTFEQIADKLEAVYGPTAT